MFVRVTKTVKDRGVLVHPEEVAQVVTDKTIDWYESPYYYGEDALEYWKNHGESIKGYKGDVWTDTLYWDLDCKEDFSKAQEGAVALLEFLEDKNLSDGIEVYFSGNKGIHIFLRTKNKFTPQETSAICYNVARKVGIPATGKNKIFDPSVYNINRIFRIVNTKHPDSGLYKIQLTDNEICNASEKEIRTLAERPRNAEQSSKPVNAKSLKKKFAIKNTVPNNVISLRNRMVEMEEAGEDIDPDDFDPMSCPRGKRRCIYVLENGYFGPSERENALIRIAAYYKGRSLDYEQIYAILTKALERRAALYPDVEPYKDEDTHRILKEVFSDGWRGGTYSCRSNSENPDVFLQGKCDLGKGPCGDEHTAPSLIDVLSINDLLQVYIDYGNEALKEYPKIGLKWMDKRLRLRPRNYSVVNGANGSGKTSLMTNIIANLNEQKIHHVIFSMDMADTSLLEKLGATFTEYDQEQIENAFNIHTRNKKIMDEVITTLSKQLPYTSFDFTSTCDSKHIESTIMHLKKNMGIDIRIAFIDYAGRLLGDNDNEFANSSQNALMANDIAKRTDAHLMYLSQVSRDNGDHTQALRTSRVAKNSGTWEENATFVINVWRPFGSGLSGADNYFHVYIGKNRTGPNGEQVFWWDGKQGKIRDMTKKEFMDYTRLCQQHDMDPPYEQFADEKKRMRRERLTGHPNIEFDEEDEEKLPNSKKSSRFRPGS